MNQTFIQQLWQKRLALIITFVAYLATALLSGYLYHGIATLPAVILAPVGVSLAAFILEGYLMWPAILLAALCNGFLGDAPLIITLGSALGNTLEPAAGLFLLRRLGFNRLFFSLKDMFALFFTVAVTTIIVPTINVLTAQLYDVLYQTNQPTYFANWWLGGALSVFVITPLIIRWVRRPVTPRTPSRYAEVAVALFFVVALSYFLFGTTEASIFGISLLYPLLVALFWLAFRGGVRFTTVALFLMTAISLGGALYGTHLPSSPVMSLSDRIVDTEILDLIFVFFFFVIVSLEEQRTKALKALAQRAENLAGTLDRISTEDEAKNEFIALLGHELRNPLASLLSSVEVLKIARPSENERMELLEGMDDRIRTMARMLDDILDISRITQRKFVLRKETVDAVDVAHRARNAVRPLMTKQRHAFLPHFPDGGLFLDADATRLEQIMVNLLHNAAKYTPPGGTIEFRGFRSGNEIVISVKDTGVGITRDMMGRIFEPFVQINPKLNRAAGIGLGLSLTKGLVEMHSGTLSVSSEGEGRGSEFIVRLPALTETPILSTEVHPSHAQTTSQMRILVVDDNEEAAQGLARLLRLRGHDATVAFEGLNVVNLADSYDPDVIILDIGLPDINGYEVARRLKEAGSDAALIALSGYGQVDDKKKAAQAGFDFHLTKPIGLKELEPVLEGIAEARRQDAKV